MKTSTHLQQEDYLTSDFEELVLSAFGDDEDIEELEGEVVEDEPPSEPTYVFKCKYCNREFKTNDRKVNHCDDPICIQGKYKRKCKICGGEFLARKPFASLCGSKECKAESMRRWKLSRDGKLGAEEMCRQKQRRRVYNRDHMRKSRRKSQLIEEKIREAERLDAQEKKFREWGTDYGKLQAQQILASIPKIDVRL